MNTVCISTKMSRPEKVGGGTKHRASAESPPLRKIGGHVPLSTHGSTPMDTTVKYVSSYNCCANCLSLANTAPSTGSHRTCNHTLSEKSLKCHKARVSCVCDWLSDATNLILATGVAFAMQPRSHLQCFNASDFIWWKNTAQQARWASLQHSGVRTSYLFNGKRMEVQGMREEK